MLRVFKLTSSVSPQRMSWHFQAPKESLKYCSIQLDTLSGLLCPDGAGENGKYGNKDNGKGYLSTKLLLK